MKIISKLAGSRQWNNYLLTSVWQRFVQLADKQSHVLPNQQSWFPSRKINIVMTWISNFDNRITGFGHKSHKRVINPELDVRHFMKINVWFQPKNLCFFTTFVIIILIIVAAGPEAWVDLSRRAAQLDTKRGRGAVEGPGRHQGVRHQGSGHQQGQGEPPGAGHGHYQVSQGVTVTIQVTITQGAASAE